jgi:WD40 repeat protein
MFCTKSITRGMKFICSVTFSSDSQILATGTKEDTISLTNVQISGELVGLTTFRTTAASTNTGTGGGGTTPGRSSSMRGTSTSSMEGAEEIAFHPNPDQYFLACLRTNNGPIPTAPVTILKLNINKL